MSARSEVLGFDVGHLVPAASAQDLAGGLARTLATQVGPGWHVHPLHGGGPSAPSQVIAKRRACTCDPESDVMLTHRADGPASLLLGVSGAWTATWYEHGQAHRADGPAVVDSTGWAVYYHRGRALLDPEVMRLGDLWEVKQRAQQVTHERFSSMTREGVAPAVALTWLRVGQAAGSARRAQGLREAGLEPAAVLAALEGGVYPDDVRALRAVTASRAPASWASRPPAPGGG